MLKIIKSTFVKSAVKESDYADINGTNFAFFGRSNAGKSSLINFLLARRNLVKVGSTPGKTRTINFFFIEASINGTESGKKVDFFITDLPGYGYAKLGKDGMKTLDMMLFKYCMNKNKPKKIFLLMDIRRDVTKVEKETFAFFSSTGIDFILVLTKADKIAKTKLPSRIKEIKSSFAPLSLRIVATSTLKNYGREEILSIIESDLLNI